MKWCSARWDAGRNGSRWVPRGVASSPVDSAGLVGGFGQPGGCSDLGGFTLAELRAPRP